MTQKYKAIFYIQDRNGYKWAETTTPLWDNYDHADNNARQYADYVNERTDRTVTGYAIKTLERGK